VDGFKVSGEEWIIKGRKAGLSVTIRWSTGPSKLPGGNLTNGESEPAGEPAGVRENVCNNSKNVKSHVFRIFKKKRKT